MTRKVLITCLTGQDSSYLAELLLKKNYEVHALVRSKQFKFPECKEIESITANLTKNVNIHQIDLLNPEGLTELICDIRPDEIYHLAAQSHVGLSFLQPAYTFQVNLMGTLHLLEAIRKSGIIRQTRLYYAGSSEMFGNNGEERQNEESDYAPASPYAISKLAGFDLVGQYADSYDLQAFRGILFNHESERRHKDFVTRKITLGIAEFLKSGKQITLGNLGARRDWGYAPEYVEGMYNMMQLADPDDFVLGTGVQISVKDFLKYACKHAGIEVYDLVDLPKTVEKRPNDVNYLCADSEKANKAFGWQPAVLVDQLIEKMVDADMEYLGVKQ